jgi:GT2 family glycosyltransferase
MSASSLLTVSVIVPVHAGAPHFHDCMRSLSRLRPAPHEVIVVADGEIGTHARLAESFGARVVKVANAGGPARARNQGAHAASGDIFFFVDSDVAVPETAVSRVAESFIAEPGMAALIGSYDEEPQASNFLSQYKNLLHHYVHQSARAEASTFWGACGAMRREVFLAMDGFDESYRRPAIEDIELGYRLKRAGHGIRLAKELQVKHLKRWSTRALLESDFRHRALPWTELILRHGRLLNDLNLRPASRASALVAWLLFISLAGGRGSRGSLVIAAVCGLALLALNAPLYGFFHRKRGLRFTTQAILWHWFYYLYSSAAFAAGAFFHLAHRALRHLSRAQGTIAPIKRS